MKILIGIITSDRNIYCIDLFSRTIKNLNCNGNEIDVIVVDNSKTNEYKYILENHGFYVIKNEWHKYARDRIETSRNIVRDYCLAGGYDYLFSVDSDIFLRRDELLRLLSYNKKFICAPYAIKKNCPNPVEVLCVQNIKNGKRQFYGFSMLHHPEPVEVTGCGMGCVLIHREILEKVKFRNDPSCKTTKEDLLFCDDVGEAGYKLWCDFSKLVSHENVGWSDIILEES